MLIINGTKSIPMEKGHGQQTNHDTLNAKQINA